MLKNNPGAKNALLFAMRIGIGYGIWRICYYFLETNLPPFWVHFQNFAALQIIKGGAFLLRQIGEPAFYNSRNLFITRDVGIYLADHCIGIPAFVVFSIFILSYQGRWLTKAWYIPFGALSIYVMNATRSAALAYLLRYYSKAYFELSHSYIYTITIYSLIFLLIVWWMEKWSKTTS